MSVQEQATPQQMRFVGIGCAGAGLYFTLIGLGVLPVPGGRSNLHGPLWLALLIGLTILLAGVAAFIQSMGPANATGDLPADAPLWMRAAQYLIGVMMFACFATIGTWVAFAGDSRYFSGGMPFVGSLNVSIARVAFGLGALICWLATIAYAVVGARRLFGGKMNP
jgi:hypothetical protein